MSRFGTAARTRLNLFSAVFLGGALILLWDIARIGDADFEPGGALETMDSNGSNHAIEFALNADEMVAFATLNLRRSPTYRHARSARVALISFALLALVAAWVSYMHALVILGGAFASVALIVLWLAYLVTEARFVRMQRAVAERSGSVPQRLLLGDESLVDEWRADQVPRHHAWSEFHDLRENELVLALYLTAPGASVDEAIVIPTRSVGAEVRDMIERRVGRKFVR